MFARAIRREAQVKSQHRFPRSAPAFSDSARTAPGFGRTAPGVAAPRGLLPADPHC